eukprot:COSAG06_NODE_32315_length_508_cov_1.002445_1_plen_68_part_01
MLPQLWGGATSFAVPLGRNAARRARPLAIEIDAAARVVGGHGKVLQVCKTRGKVHVKSVSLTWPQSGD